jgi:hypothetical protein
MRLVPVEGVTADALEVIVAALRAREPGSPVASVLADLVRDWDESDMRVLESLDLGEAA